MNSKGLIVPEWNHVRISAIYNQVNSQINVSVDNLIFHNHRMLVVLMVIAITAVISKTAYAESKPHAPESIENVTNVSAEQAIDLILENPNMPIVDSRKRTEFVKGHIEGAVSILNTEMTEQDLKVIAPDKDAAILFYCNGERCLRSTDAIRKAISWGYTNLIWFRGGWKEWTEKRLPVVTD